MTTASESRLRALDALLDAQELDESFAGDLFAVVDALEASAALRRAVTDPGAPEGMRRALVRRLLAGKVSDSVVEFVGEAAELRWAGGRTLAAALDRQAARAALIGAERLKQLAETEDELFRFARTVEANPELRNALSDRMVDFEHRQQLVSDLLGGRATAATEALARRAVRARERSFEVTLEGFVTLAADQRHRLVATVRVATSMSPEQRQRLRAALMVQTGRDVTLQEILDESVLGGVLVELADEVIDGTVAGRLDQAERLFG